MWLCAHPVLPVEFRSNVSQQCLHNQRVTTRASPHQSAMSNLTHAFVSMYQSCKYTASIYHIILIVNFDTRHFQQQVHHCDVAVATSNLQGCQSLESIHQRRQTSYNRKALTA